MALVKEAMARLDASGKRFLQFKRVTIDMSQDSQIQSISANNPLLSAFDIVAVQPMTEKLFLAAVQSTEIDLISFDATKRMNYRIKTAVARQAVDSGIMFEICFKDALRDPQARKTAFSNARRIIEATKGKNVVISSGAKEAILLRGPYDLINLSHIFGLEASIARKALSQNPRAVLLHAQTRRSYRGVVDLHQIADLEEHMKWTVPALGKQAQNSMMGLMDAEAELSGDDEDSEEDETGATSLSFHMDIDTPQASSSMPVLTSSKGSLPEKKAKGKRKRDD
jgi:ribonuclease P/MRP protein subunit RPP1